MACSTDPHPGNYLLSPNGEVTLLDFGCVRRFEAPFIDTWKTIAVALVEGRRSDFETAFATTGLVASPKRFNWDHQWELMKYLYAPLTSKTPFTYTGDYVSSSRDLMIFDNPNRFKVGMPPEWLLTNRLQWGLNSVLAQLEAQADWASLWWEAITSETRIVPQPAAGVG